MDSSMANRISAASTSFSALQISSLIFPKTCLLQAFTLVILCSSGFLSLLANSTISSMVNLSFCVSSPSDWNLKWSFGTLRTEWKFCATCIRNVCDFHHLLNFHILCCLL